VADGIPRKAGISDDLSSVQNVNSKGILLNLIISSKIGSSFSSALSVNGLAIG
jgi:hypothetical protein